MCMSRTNIEIDDDLIAEVMNVFDLPTKKSAVEFALQRALERHTLRQAMDALFDSGWEGPERFDDSQELNW